MSDLTNDQASTNFTASISALGKLHPIHYPNTTEKKNKETIMPTDTPASPRCSPIMLDDEVSVFELDL